MMKQMIQCIYGGGNSSSTPAIFKLTRDANSSKFVPVDYIRLDDIEEYPAAILWNGKTSSN